MKLPSNWDDYYMNTPTDLSDLYPHTYDHDAQSDNEVEDFIQQGKMVLMLLAFTFAAYFFVLWLYS